MTGGSFAWIGGCGGAWPGGARDLRGSVLADYRRLAREVPVVAVRRTGSLVWSQASAGASPADGQSWVGRDEIRGLEPRLRGRPERAVHTPSDGGVDPVAVTGTLVGAARGLGAKVIFGAAVESPTIVGGRVVGVASSIGFHPASVVVLAAGTEVARPAEPLGVEVPVAVSP